MTAVEVAIYLLGGFIFAGLATGLWKVFTQAPPLYTDVGDGWCRKLDRDALLYKTSGWRVELTYSTENGELSVAYAVIAPNQMQFGVCSSLDEAKALTVNLAEAHHQFWKP